MMNDAASEAMNPSSRDVVVIGGGVSGLAAAWQFKKAGVDVGLIEAAPHVGGCTRTERRDGFLLEKGPFNVMARDTAFEDLLEDFSDVAPVVSADEAAGKRFIYRHGRILAVPSNPFALLTTPLLSFGSRLRILSSFVAGRRATAREETVEEVATRRFGREVSDTMISAVVAGIFAGDIRKLSLRACFPKVGKIDRENRSLFMGGLGAYFRAKEARGGKPRRWRGLISTQGGIGALTAAIGERLGPGCVANRKVDAIRHVTRGYEISLAEPDGGSGIIPCRRVVLAVSASEAARLLEPLAPEATQIINRIESASLVVLNIGFKSTDVGHPMQGYGFLVPHDEANFPLLGVLWADSVFPQHAPAGHRLLRVFVGGSRDPRAAERSDEALLDIAMTSLRDLLDIRGRPVLTDVCRYPKTIPQYHVGHVEKIDRLDAILAEHPGLRLVGNYLRGISVNDAIAFGARTAQEMIREIGDPTGATF